MFSGVFLPSSARIKPFLHFFCSTFQDENYGSPGKTDGINLVCFFLRGREGKIYIIPLIFMNLLQLSIR